MKPLSQRAGREADRAGTLWRGQDQFRRVAADAPGRSRSSACATNRMTCSSAPAHGQKFFSPISARPPTSPRARPLPRAFSRPAVSRPSTTRDLPIRPPSPPRSRHPARRWRASAPPTRSMPGKPSLPPRPFKRRAQSISIWQAGPASRKPRLRDAAVGDFIFAGGDALATLQDAYRLMGET